MSCGQNPNRTRVRESEEPLSRARFCSHKDRQVYWRSNLAGCKSLSVCSSDHRLKWRPKLSQLAPPIDCRVPLACATMQELPSTSAYDAKADPKSSHPDEVPEESRFSRFFPLKGRSLALTLGERFPHETPIGDSSQTASAQR